jgi:prefoldin subunit 5
VSLILEIKYLKKTADELKGSQGQTEEQIRELKERLDIIFKNAEEAALREKGLPVETPSSSSHKDTRD